MGLDRLDSVKHLNGLLEDSRMGVFSDFFNVCKDQSVVTFILVNFLSHKSFRECKSYCPCSKYY